MLQSTEHVLKEGAEALLRRTRRSLCGKIPANLDEALSAVRARGFAVIREFWPLESCARAIEQIDEALDTDTQCHRWADAEGADQRLYFAERVGGELARYHSSPQIELYRRYYTGVKRADTLLLAAKLSQAAGNKGSGGGWHRDSPHRTQFKAILYLSDVTAKNGPFEYLESSHGVVQSLRLLFGGKVRANQYRFSDSEITELCAHGATPRTFVAPAGTLLLVDSKGIHRGRPIEQGCRYALTQYCFDGARPADFFG